MSRSIRKRPGDVFLGQILPAFQGGPIWLVIDLTAYEEHAQVIYIGLLQHSRVLPLVWKVMPGARKMGSRVMG